MPTTGPQLRKERLAADVKVTAVAARMALSRQTIHALEKEHAPDPARVAAYREAVTAERNARLASRDSAA